VNSSRSLLVLVAPLLLLVACAHAESPAPGPRLPPAVPPKDAVAPLPHAGDAVPLLRLPADTHPLDEAIELHIDPGRDRFSGAVDIEIALDEPRAVLWLHGKDMNVVRATVTPDGAKTIAAVWKERGDSGIASLTMASAVPAGKAKLHVELDAPFGKGQKGLYKTTEAGESYVFTQFEAIAARMAFPCFDEPGFKIPYTTTLVVPAGLQAIANTHEVSRTPEGPSVRVSFATTVPLPSYLVAFAVGAFDVVSAPDVPPNAVRARALPLRAVIARGRGKDVAYALAHAGEILATLEGYVGMEFPYDKLDLLAVPGKGGAMENAGAITFGERLLLFEPATASIGQRRAYAGVVAHELAHMWTGDLVTMQWWDDTWLNEAFATWLGNKAVDAWDPSLHADMSLLRGAQGAMAVDSLVSARAIRQPIVSTHDIENAFDAITYQKGGAVLAMFETWAGARVWQQGLHAYLAKHRFGNATADDFLDAENEATGKDIKTAFHTFLDQSGVPLLEASLVCPPPHAPGRVVSLHLAQSRFLPIGSTGDANRTWQIPVCIRTDAGVTCSLLSSREGQVDLGGASAACPAYVFPNADAAGYYRFALAPRDLAALRAHGISRLTTHERVAYGTSLRSAYARGTTPMKDIFAAVAPLASDRDPAVAEEPMGYVSQARDWLFADEALRGRIEAYGRDLYAPVAGRLGWVAKKGESDETRTLRASVLSFLALTAQDRAVRAEAKKRALAYIGFGTDGEIHAEAVDPNLVAAALAVAGEEADRATWDAMKALFSRSVDEQVRSRLLSALSGARDPELARSAQSLVVDPTLRDSEIMTPLGVQLSNPATRDEAWDWIKNHYEAILTRLPRHHGGVGLVSTGRSFCDAAHAADVEAFFAPKIDAIDGGPRTLAATLEDVRLCAARRHAQEPSAREMFAHRH
jgi:cytosol alanyl aminopeptidase